MGRSAMAWPPGDGAMAERVRTHDWAATPLGAAATWPDRIRAVVELVLASPLVSTVALGDARLLIYNDAAARLYGAHHPGALGRPLAAVFPDSYPAVAPLYDRVFAGESVPVAGQPLALDTGDEVFDAYLSPVRDAAGAVIAAHMVGLEIGAQQRDAAALRDSEARYRTLFEAIDSGFCIIELIFADGRATDYRFVEANPALERQSGLVGAVGRRIREFAPDLEEHWFERYGQVALTGEPLRIEGEVAPLGRWFDINAFRIGAPEQRRVAVLFTDITARRDADAAVRESQERQAFLLELSDRLRMAGTPQAAMAAAAELFARRTGVAVAHYLLFHPDQEGFDFAGGYSDGRLPAALTQGSGRLSDHGPGWGDQFRRGEAVFSDNHDDRPAADAAASRALGIRSGSAVPLIRDGRLVAIFSSAHPEPRRWTEAEKLLQHEVAERTWAAVERAQAERALRDREADLARAQRIGQVASVEVILTDPPTGLRSPEYRRLHGLAPDDAVETHREWLARVHPDDRARADREFFAAIDGDDVLESEYRIVRPSDGEVRWISARGMIERDAHGAPTRLLGAHIDITERKRADLAVRESEERQVFLLELSDALRPLEDAADIERTAVDLLGAKLGVNRAFYATVEDDGDTVIVRHAYIDGVAPGTGRHSIASFRPERMPEWQAGQMTMTADSETDPKFGDVERGAYAAVSTRAAVGVPLVKRGRLVALLAVNQATPRAWTDRETSLIAEVAERTWLAVDRARIEAALHETEERLQQFGEASQDVLWIRDAGTFQWEYLTPAFEPIYGLTRAAALRGDNMTGWLELIVPEDRDHAAKSLARVRDGEWVTFQFRFRRPSDGSIRWMRNTDFPIKDAAGKVIRIGGIGHDITALKETEDALSAAEQRQRALLEGIPQLVWRAVDGGRWTWASPQWTAVTGQAAPDSHEYGWLDPVHPDDRAGVLDVWKGAIARGEFHADYRICHQPTGRYRWFQTRASPVRDDDGAIVEWLGTSTDVDHQRRLQEHQGVLLAELQHRVRNILAIIRSIMRRSLDGEESLQDYAQHLEGRITALARTQVLLTRQVNANVDLEELIRDELTAQAADDARIVIAGPDVDLSPRAAEVLALAMHELATNSVKYGAIAHPDAALRVEWRLEERDDVRWLYLIWSELGVPVAAGAPARAGFGTELITRRVPYELKGAGELAIKSGGIVCTISFPLIDRPSILETGPTEATRGVRP